MAKDHVNRATSLFKEGKEIEAFEQLAEAVVRWPNEPLVWSGRAHLFALSQQYRDAVTDLDRAIELSDPLEPHLLFDRGRMLHLIGMLNEAEADFSTLLDLEKKLGWEHYSEMAYFFRAAILLDLGRPEEALADIGRVRADMFVYHGSLGPLSAEKLKERAREGR